MKVKLLITALGLISLAACRVEVHLPDTPEPSGSPTVTTEPSPSAEPSVSVEPSPSPEPSVTVSPSVSITVTPSTSPEPSEPLLPPSDYRFTAALTGSEHSYLWRNDGQVLQLNPSTLAVQPGYPQPWSIKCCPA